MTILDRIEGKNKTKQNQNTLLSETGKVENRSRYITSYLSSFVMVRPSTVHRVDHGVPMTTFCLDSPQINKLKSGLQHSGVVRILRTHI